MDISSRLKRMLVIVLSASMVLSANALRTSAEEEDYIDATPSRSENLRTDSEDDDESQSDNEKEESVSSDVVETDNYRVTLYFYSDKLTNLDTVSASEIKEDSDEYRKTIETLSNNEIEYDYIAPIDISLLDNDGNEFEPEDGAVKSLTIETLDTEKVADILEDVQVNSLKIVHLKSDDEAETVADTGDESDGTIDVEIENEGTEDERIISVSADFEADSFSTYVLLSSSVSTTELEEVETIDSSEIGFKMYMVDYGKLQYTQYGSMSSDYEKGDYGKGSIKQGLYSSTTQGDGEDYEKFPTFLKTGTSIKQYVSGNLVDNLFIKDRHDKYGNFYFNSAEYFASLMYDSAHSSFKVFKQLGTPSNEKIFYYQRGNFMPYNSLNIKKVLNNNYYGDNGVKLSTSNARYDENLYGFNEANRFHFGYYGYGYFFQPSNGEITVKEDGDNGEVVERIQDMTYEFIGDDDMLVYVDGVLVLDLGGIHDGQTGTINFKTGEVTYSTSNYNDIVTGKGPSYKTTTIRAMFEKAGMEDTEDWEDSQDGATLEYASGKKHLLQMFYLERGEGASNLKLDFNLTPVPQGAVTVHKAVSLNSAQIDYSQEYTMQILDSDGNPVSNASYYYDDSSNVTRTTDENGEFSLKPGETAIFIDLDMDKTWKFKELSSDYQYVDEYVVTDKKGNVTTYKISDGTYDSWEGISPSEEVGKSDVSLVIDNNFHTSDLKVNKKFVVNGEETDSAPDMSEFNNAQFVLQQKIGDEWQDLSSVSYNSFEDGSFAFEDLQIQVTADSECSYRIVEAISDNDASEKDKDNYSNVDGGDNKIAYLYTTVSVNGENRDGVISDSISLDKDDEDKVTEITFTNYYETVYVPPTGVDLPDNSGAGLATVIILITMFGAFVLIDRKKRTA